MRWQERGNRERAGSSWNASGTSRRRGQLCRAQICEMIRGSLYGLKWSIIGHYGIEIPCDSAREVTAVRESWTTALPRRSSFSPRRTRILSRANFCSLMGDLASSEILEEARIFPRKLSPLRLLSTQSAIRGFGTWVDRTREYNVGTNPLAESSYLPLVLSRCEKIRNPW